MNTRCTIDTRDAPRAIGPYSQAVAAAGFIFVSGQIAIDPTTQKVIEGGVEAQTERALGNVEAILRAAGVDLKAVVRCVVYLTDLEDFAAMNGVYRRYFPSDMPARTTVSVVGLPANVKVEIEATAIARHAN